MILVDFGTKMDPSWYQNHIQKQYYVKTARKQKIAIFQKNLMIFHNSGIDFWRQNPSKNQLQNDIQDSIPKFNPLWRENQTQDTSKTLPRRPHDAPRGPKTLQDVLKTAPGRLQDDPKTPPRRFKILSRRPQDGSKPPKTPQNASKTPQDAPRRLQDVSKMPPDLDFGRYLIDFWSIFDWCARTAFLKFRRQAPLYSF